MVKEKQVFICLLRKINRKPLILEVFLNPGPNHVDFITLSLGINLPKQEMQILIFKDNFFAEPAFLYI